LPTTARQGDLVFVGRLVSEKGCNLLLIALASLPPAWAAIRLTILGDGPERPVLEKQAAALGLGHRVHFAGVASQERVASELRRHKILVVPSLYVEPFGVVALEGAACGCIVLGSDGGGLPEAIGPAGMTFRRGDPADLSAKLTQLLENPANYEPSAILAHLERHQPSRIAAEYRDLFKQVLTQARKATEQVHELRN
jgi:glycogen(starch) synthase